MNKKDLVSKIADEAGLLKKDAEKFLRHFDFTTSFIAKFSDSARLSPTPKIDVKIARIDIHQTKS